MRLSTPLSPTVSLSKFPQSPKQVFLRTKIIEKHFIQLDLLGPFFIYRADIKTYLTWQ